MSVLLVGVRGELGRAVAVRLIAEGDQVRVVEDRPAAADEWVRLGAHVAHGSGADPDLIERAAQGVRTVVVGEDESVAATEVVDAVLEGARIGSRSDIRLVVLTTASSGEGPAGAVVSSGLDHVIVRIPTTRRFLRSSWSRYAASIEALAAVIDAADDLAGNPREELDLSSEAAWNRLRLEPPG
jgi:nucleoside-diphosphate-sugar epimerase